MQIRYPKKLKSIVKRLSNMFMESRFTIPLSKSGEECKRKVCETFPVLEDHILI